MRQPGHSASYTAYDTPGLLALVRAGDHDAFGELFVRYQAFAYKVARRASRREADDLVAEAFRRVYTALSRGHGPSEAFGPYLATTIRSAAAGLAGPYQTVEFGDRHDMSEDKPEVDPRVTTAYLSLPESWQNALWYSDVEGLSPRQAAPMLGLPSANAFSALRARARAGLRSAYLLDIVNDDVCNDTVRDQLAALIDGNTTPEAVDRVVDEHLDECDRCSAVATRVATVTGSRAGVVVAAAMVSFHGFTASSSLMPAPVGLAGLASRVQSNASNAAAAAAVLVLIVGGGLFVKARAGDSDAQLPAVVAAAQVANAGNGGDDTLADEDTSSDGSLDAPALLAAEAPNETTSTTPSTTLPASPDAASAVPPAGTAASTSTTAVRRVITTVAPVVTLKPASLAPVPITTVPITSPLNTTTTSASTTTTPTTATTAAPTSTTTKVTTSTSTTTTTSTPPSTTTPTSTTTSTTVVPPELDTMRYAVAQAGGVLHVSVAVLNLSGQGGTVTFSNPVILPKSPTMECGVEICSLPLGDDAIGTTSYVTFTVPAGGTTVTLTTPSTTSSFYAFGY